MKKHGFLKFFVCICQNVSVFAMYFWCIWSVFGMYCMYLAECVWIDATNNFSCKKYKQIHTIQTHSYKYKHDIHTKIHTLYIQNKSVTMCMYAHVCACMCLYFFVFCMYVCIIALFWVQTCIRMYVYVSVCINSLSLFTSVYPWAVGLHRVSQVAEHTRKGVFVWHFVLFFKGPQPGSLWATQWPTCWCSTGGCLSRVRHDGRTRPA